MRGYPTILYFPNDEELQGQYVKYRGGRNITAFESWIFEKGYQAFTEDAPEIPPYLLVGADGGAPYGKPPKRLIYEIQAQIDKFFVYIGLSAIPPLARYLITAIACLSPFGLFACCLIWCDSYDEHDHEGHVH